MQSFSKIAKALFGLVEKDKKFIWGSEQHETFQTLKSKLTGLPILAHFNPKIDCGSVTGSRYQ